MWYFLQSLKSRGYVKEQFAWRHHYWYLTNEGIQYLRDFLHLPPEIVPSTLKRQARAETARPRGRGQYFSFIGCCDLTFHSRVLHCNYLTSCSPFIYMYIAKKKCHTHVRQGFLNTSGDLSCKWFIKFLRSVLIALQRPLTTCCVLLL